LGVWGFACRVWCLGFMVWGIGMRIRRGTDSVGEALGGYRDWQHRDHDFQGDLVHKKNAFP